MGISASCEGRGGETFVTVLTLTETNVYPSTNESDITAVFTISAQNVYTTNDSPWSYAVNGIHYSGTLPAAELNGSKTTTLDTRTIRIKHDSDGSKTIGFSSEIRVLASITITASNSMTLTKIDTSHTVTYNANGGTGAPGPQIKYVGSILTLSSVIPTRTGYQFKGWGTSSSSVSPAYQPGALYGADADITLYAIWEKVTLIDFNVSEITLSIPDDELGHPILTPLSIPFTVISDSTNNQTSFYYKLSAAGDPETISGGDTILGPYTSAGISSGTISDSAGRQIPVPVSLITASMNRNRSSEKLRFLLMISTASNSFSDSFTVSKIISVNLEHYFPVCILSAFTERAIKTPDLAELTLCYIMAKSYVHALSDIHIQNSLSEDYDFSVIDTSIEELLLYKRVTTHIKFTDHINSDKNIRLMISVSDHLSAAKRSANLYSTHLNKSIDIIKNNSMCEALEFIESSETFMGSNGKMYAEEFIEADGELLIAGQSKYGTIAERTITFSEPKSIKS